MRWALRTAVLLLSVALVVQIVVEHRNRLVATTPTLAPWLRRLCETAGCAIEPMRRISAIAIDHASLNKLDAGEYRLRLSVRNRSDLELATPALELTLTDLQDRPVVRRVLLPSELGVGDTIAAHGGWSGSVTMAVSGKIDHIVGYKTLAFYP